MSPYGFTRLRLLRAILCRIWRYRKMYLVYIWMVICDHRRISQSRRLKNSTTVVSAKTVSLDLANGKNSHWSRVCLKYNIPNDIENNVCTQVTNCQRSREGYFCITIITHEWAQKQLVTRINTLFHFLHDTTNTWMTMKTMIFRHRPRVSLAQSFFCWWRHRRLLMTSR